MNSKKLSIRSLNQRSDQEIIASPDIVFKMAKKIAQLTKVIYFLHTKTEDHNDELDYLAEKIQDHVDSMNEKSSRQITGLSMQFEESKILLKAHEDMIAVNLFF